MATDQMHVIAVCGDKIKGLEPVCGCHTYFLCMCGKINVLIVGAERKIQKYRSNCKQLNVA